MPRRSPTRLIAAGATVVVALGLTAGCSKSAGDRAATKPLPQPTAFAECARCHRVEPGVHDVGPSLWGLSERRAGSALGYSFSPALRGAGFTWDRQRLAVFLRDPHKTLPGTRMLYPGLEDAKEAESVADYVLSLR
ncbi:cytochrome c family protein [Phenylobacterium sp.]|uniref:c-type cytochrome n=1 Tax=Phenylobacterium sp. TaxID=1871053 RepID=UPI003523F513